MSSHHIVKEDQEPALVIDHFDGISLNQMEQLLEWSPTVIAHVDNFDAIIGQNIKIDVLFSHQAIDLPQDHVLRLPLSGEFLDGALSYLIDRDYQAVNIVSKGVSPEVLLRYAKDTNVALLGNGLRISVVKQRFSKWKPQGESLYVYGDNPVIATEGLTQRGINHYFTEEDGFCSIRFASEYGLVGEPL